MGFEFEDIVAAAIMDVQGASTVFQG